MVDTVGTVLRSTKKGAGLFRGSIIKGKAPIRKDCEVIGYTEKSLNASLVFDLPHD